MPARVLVLYASTHGHTATIAARVAGRLRGAGFAAEVVDAFADRFAAVLTRARP